MRNKLYVINKVPHFNDYENQCAYLDMGKILANAYGSERIVFERESNFDSFSYFSSLLRGVIADDKTRLVISNFGILCEKNFALDVARFFLELAKDYQVFLVWKGNINNQTSLVWNVECPKNKIEFDKGVLETIGEDNEIL